MKTGTPTQIQIVDAGNHRALAIIAYHCAAVAAKLKLDNGMFWQDEHVCAVSALLQEGLHAAVSGDNEPDMCGFEIHDSRGARGEVLLNLYTGDLVLASGGEESVVWPSGDHASIHGWQHAGDCDGDDVIDALNTFPGVGHLARRVEKDIETAYYIDLDNDGAPVLTFVNCCAPSSTHSAHYSMMRLRLI